MMLAVVAHDADKVERLAQTVEYLREGVAGVQRWIDSSRVALKMASANISSTPPSPALHWHV